MLKRKQMQGFLCALMFSGMAVCSVRGAAAQVPPARPPAGGSVTARADLPQLTKAAQAWHADAVLCWISTVMADAQGKAQGFGGWDFRFCSKSANQQYAVAHTPAGFHGNVVGKADRPALPTEFVDSDRAMAVAKGAGFAPKRTSLMTLDPAPGGQGFVWTIYGPEGIADTSKQYLVDATTGSLAQAGK